MMGVHNETDFEIGDTVRIRGGIECPTMVIQKFLPRIGPDFGLQFIECFWFVNDVFTKQVFQSELLEKHNPENARWLKTYLEMGGQPDTDFGKEHQ